MLTTTPWSLVLEADLSHGGLNHLLVLLHNSLFLAVVALQAEVVEEDIVRKNHEIQARRPVDDPASHVTTTWSQSL